MCAMMKVLCVNDANRPNEIPASKWIKEGETYHVVDVIKCNVQGGAHGYVLQEIDLSGCDPYKCFSVKRFIPVHTVMLTEEELLELQLHER